MADTETASSGPNTSGRNNSGAVNSQVADAVSRINAHALGGSPAEALAAATQAMAHAMGLAMENATMAQAAVQQINTAAMSMVISEIIKTPAEASAVAPASSNDQAQ